MLKFILVISCLLPGIAWGDSSYGKHFAVSGAVSSITCAAFKSTDKPLIGAVIGFSTAMFIGHMKEKTDPVYDKTDMTFNALGAVGGIGLCLSF